MEFYLKVGANYFSASFCIVKPILFSKFSESSLFLLILGQNNHPPLSLKIALQSVKSLGFFLFWWVATLDNFLDESIKCVVPENIRTPTTE